ncbi:hypothetical protein JZ751_018912 [Albula glossodonta]|uniref:Annexin n=1 Tax=Albula glossodonta TaxID=121402 RepID=A0A8T2MT08_9TELE|nr:hypothetical protein JZ751_018912 [Albula glossodonta]
MSFIREFLQQTVYLGMPDDSASFQGTVTPHPQFSASGDVGILDKAIKVKGVDETTIIDVLVRRSNAQRQQIKAAYQQACGKAARSEDPTVNEELADNDARALYEAGEKRKGTDLSVFIDILTTRSPQQLRKAIDLELKGDIENCLTAIVKCAGSKPAFFAEKLYLSMKILTRVMVSRSEVDMKRIKEEYQKKYGKTLYQEILDDTKGDYEKILLAICGEN